MGSSAHLGPGLLTPRMESDLIDLIRRNGATFVTHPMSGELAVGIRVGRDTLRPGGVVASLMHAVAEA